MVVNIKGYKCDLCGTEVYTTLQQIDDDLDIFGIELDQKNHMGFLKKIPKEKAQRHICIHCIYDIKQEDF